MTNRVASGYKSFSSIAIGQSLKQQKVMQVNFQLFYYHCASTIHLPLKEITTGKYATSPMAQQFSFHYIKCGHCRISIKNTIHYTYNTYNCAPVNMMSNSKCCCVFVDSCCRTKPLHLSSS